MRCLLLIVQITSITYCLAQFDIRIGLITPELPGAPTEEEFLNKLIDNELNSLDKHEPCLRDGEDPDSIARRMDRLAERLSMAMDGPVGSGTTNKIEEELADAVRLQDFFANNRRPVRARRFRNDLGTRSMDRVLEPDNPYIYHSNSLSSQAIMQLAQAVTQRALREDDRQFSFQMLDYATRRAEEDNPSNRVEELRQTLKEVANRGRIGLKFAYYWADQLYFRSEFLEEIPILGHGIKELKRIGRRPFEIMETVRYMHRVWTKFSEELPKTNSHTRQVLTSPETKKMFSESGIKAVQAVAMKLLLKGGSSSVAGTEMAEVQEIASRCAYYLFSQLVPHSAYCLIGRRSG